MPTASVVKTQKRHIKEALALWALFDDPTRTMDDIANFVGCHRTSLYRMDKFVQAWKCLRSVDTRAKPRGHLKFNKDDPRKAPMDIEAYAPSADEE
jgi:hypothetical protein